MMDDVACAARELPINLSIIPVTPDRNSVHHP